jgi:hypothetical protein
MFKLFLGLLAIWDLSFTIFDVVKAIESYSKGNMPSFWLFVIAGVLMFVFFIVTLTVLIKEINNG